MFILKLKYSAVVICLIVAEESQHDMMNDAN
jgi:hypothetical protein